jgi:ATP-dependent exoDNAse (exonuclease V) alpha subunit
MVAHIDKPTFTRADLVELVGALLPVEAPGDPRALIEQIVDTVGVRVSAARDAHHREGHELFTVDAVIAEEQRVFDVVDEADSRARLDVRTADLDDLSADQARAIANIAASPYLVQPLQAPAGTGKTHSLQALRSAAQRTNKEVLVLAPTGKAVDEAIRGGAGDRGLTVAKALHLIEDKQFNLDRRIVIVVDEASMVATPELRRLLEVSTVGHAKMVLVGDAYQLSPVKARGGMFEHLCDDLPWRLGEVWRMRDPGERDASLALRSARGNRLRKAVGWYRNHDRLHTGDPIAMAADATSAYITARAEGKDVAILCDTWHIADAINQRLHDWFTAKDAPSVAVARDQQVRVGDLILSRRNDATLAVEPGTHHRRGDRIDQVRNGNRWRVVGVDATHGRVAAERLTDSARVIFDGASLREHITLGYAGTVASAQGVTIGSSHQYGICWTVLSDRASRAMAYVGMTRGRDENHLAIYPSVTNEAHQHQHGADTGIHQMRRGTKHAAAHALHVILTANDDRASTVVAALLDRSDQRRADRAQAWRRHSAQTHARETAYERITATRQQTRERERSRRADRGYGLEL